jgi:uncharacterized DUF497 family protein
VPLNFSWDPRKAASNTRKHAVSFEEAATAFADPLSLTIVDPDHSGDEERFILLGVTYRGQTVVVAHTEAGNDIRIISARPATAAERRAYEQG